MRNNFTIFDEVNNIRIKAQSILKFNINNKEYLIYTTSNGDDNTKKILLSSLYKQENKYLLSDITMEEKEYLNNLVYNMMMSLPFKKDKDGSALITEFMKKNTVRISLELPELNDEKYYTNSVIAKVSSETIEKSIDFYHIHLDEEKNNKVEEKDISINTWEIPSIKEVSSASENFQETPKMQVNDTLDDSKAQNIGSSSDSATYQSVDISINPISNIDMPNINLFTEGAASQNANVSNESVTPQDSNISVNDASLTDQTQTNIETNDNENFPNPQAEILSMMNNLNTNNNFNTQPNIMRSSEKGNVNTKYIVIGTVCIILALLVVAATCIMINNLK